MRGYAGLPHPEVSLAKVIVSLNGDARSMPWNSSKSDISVKHEVSQAIRLWLMETLKDYAASSHPPMKGGLGDTIPTGRALK